MNERIRHLAILCSEECGDYHIGSNPQFNYEKFVKLLIKEYLDELCNQMEAHNINLANLPAWYKALEKTEQHFGIKE